mgnify:CR=1 FL=1
MFLISISRFDFEFRFRVPISSSDFEFLISFGPYVLAVGASLDLTYWPFAPAWSLYTGLSGQLDPYVLALRASFVLSGPNFPIYPKTGLNQFFITWKFRKPAMFYFWNIKKRRHTKYDLSPSFTLLHLPRRCSIFGTSKNGVTRNMTPVLHLPSFIYPVLHLP